MIIQLLRDAIASAAQRPKGVKISEALWKELVSEGLVTTKMDWTVFITPYFDENICLIHDFDLDYTARHFVLPTR